MGSGFGYAYRHTCRMDDEIMARYVPLQNTKGSGFKVFFFEFRTKFMVEEEQGKRTVVGSERFHERCVKDEGACIVARRRLWEDYWMVLDETGSLCCDAFDYARKSEIENPDRDVIPVVVEIEVCTVQQAGEPISATFERAIQPDRLRPVYLNTLGVRPPYPVSPMLESHLRLLPRIRVESVEQGRALMDACQICSRKPTIGDVITHLRCQHAFHSHCAVKWLVHSNLCPSCHSQEHSFVKPKIKAPVPVPPA
ncbi:unnamed protein product [Cuscuta campestris]|uniref:RING-type domain-containing protein n=1 Tax=Cuscuta campestris TaxID=132261 RepID=A0A484L9U2_9ASTE|nr:unnamed protein product [Cuscuta campestris]